MIFGASALHHKHFLSGDSEIPVTHCVQVTQFTCTQLRAVVPCAGLCNAQVMRENLMSRCAKKIT